MTSIPTVSPAQPSTDHTSPPAQFVRIIHNPAPDLTYKVQVRDPQSRPQEYTTHDLAQEPTLFSFSTSTFSFANYGLFGDFLSSHTPANVASISTVQWEAHDDWDVAGGSTLAVAKKLVRCLPGLKQVVILLAMAKKDREAGIVKSNLREWKEGLAAMKIGLQVVVRWIEPGRFEAFDDVGSFRKVDPTGGKLSLRMMVGLWNMDTRSAYTDRL